MDVTYTARGTGGRGRPRSPAPAYLLDILQRTYTDGTQAVVSAVDATETERNELCKLIRNGALELGKQPKIYGARRGPEICFWMEDRPDE